MSKKILLIEDEEPIVKALYRMLQSRGYEMSKALTGEDGLKIALFTHPDMILLDIVLPGMDGVEVLRKLRADPWGKDAKVIIITNLSDTIKEQQARGIGVLDYLIKSNLSLKMLADTIDSYLQPASDDS